jgi:hypothetical protein
MIRLGLNTSAQDTIEKAPKNLLIEDIDVSTLRGKRAIEVNAQNVVIQRVKLLDIYSPYKQDSQAIAVLNSPGNVTVQNFLLEAASENFMVGGDTMKIPNCRPTGIIVRDGTLSKNLEWKTLKLPDGSLAVPVKNLLELKDGNDVLIQRVVARNCWKSAQDGYCFMFTPSQGGSVRGVKVEDCDVDNVGSIVNITGTDASKINFDRTQVSFAGGVYKTKSKTMGGRGCFALITRGPEYLDVTDCDIEIDGTAFLTVGDKASVDRIKITGCRFNTGTKYEISIGGYHNGNNSLGIVKQLIVENNTILGASPTFKKNFPNNIYI